jgi:hypothetical protein
VAEMKIGQGFSRFVLVFDSFVIKFPKIKRFNYCWYNISGYLYGFACNVGESITYNFFKYNCCADRLAKVYYCAPFGLFLIMEKVDIYNNFKQKHADWLYENVLKKELVLFNGRGEYIIGIDIFKDNIGFRNRKAVLVDYA